MPMDNRGVRGKAIERISVMLDEGGDQDILGFLESRMKSRGMGDSPDGGTPDASSQMGVEELMQKIRELDQRDEEKLRKGSEELLRLLREPMRVMKEKKEMDAGTSEDPARREMELKGKMKKMLPWLKTESKLPSGEDSVYLSDEEKDEMVDTVRKAGKR